MPKIIPGVLRHPKAGRVSENSGTVCVGLDMERAISSYNTTATEKNQVVELPYSGVRFSDKIGKAAEEALAGSKLGKFVGTNSYQ